jgi:class 3 adenylate cyclase/tetratricopeptide (TPR) repeat protein
MSICSSCGHENPEAARFCNACAAPLAAPSLSEERKVVTVLFADLVGFTSRAEQLDPEDVRALLSPYHARLRSELRRFGGTVEKFIGDAVMALFGAPKAHEDDPERAVRAALAIRDAVAELNEADPKLELQVRVAVTTGEALVALGARVSAGEGMASGDVVNTASRLQTAAPVNGVLVGEVTYRATRDLIEYRNAEPVHAKGKAKPVPVWEAIQARSRAGLDVVQTGRAQLVGRRRELDLLLDAFERAREGRAPQLLTLVGVPGIGKSRLVWELFLVIDQRDELVYWRQGRSPPYGEGVSFWAIGEIVKAHAGILDTDTASEAEQKLDHMVREALGGDPQAGWVERHLRVLVGLGGEREPLGDRRDESFAAWRRFFEAVADRRPLVLVLEDLHWADDALLDFVDDLSDRAAEVPLLLLGTTRPELLQRRPDWGGGKLNAHTVSLAPLSDVEATRLVDELLDQAVLPAELHPVLLERAGGNPLYAEQYVRMLKDRGLLVRDRAGWRLGDRAELPLPETVQGIIAARLDGLPPEEKTLLEDAAVLGKVFWTGALHALDGWDASALDELLYALARKDFVRRERRSSVGGEKEYAFRHVLVSDVAYGLIPRSGRAEKHRRAAEWIESLSADRVEDYAEMLAHHYSRALEFARAAGQESEVLERRTRLALRAAGERASALNAFPAAVRFFAAALELWPLDDDQRPYLLLAYGKALSNTHDAEVGILDEASDGLLRLGAFAEAAEGRHVAGTILWRRGDNHGALERLGQGEELALRAADSRATALVLTYAAFFRQIAGEPEQAVRVGRDAVAMTKRLALDALSAQALNLIGLARLNMGDLGGLSELEASIPLVEQASEPEFTWCHGNLASVYYVLGELDRAFELFEVSLREAERFGVQWAFLRLETMSVFKRYHEGSWHDFEAFAEARLAEAERSGSKQEEIGRRIARASVRRARGDASAALEDTKRALELARSIGLQYQLHDALACRARTLLAAGRAEEAGDAANELLRGWAPERAWTAAAGTSIDLAPTLAALDRGSEFEAAMGRYETMSKWVDAGLAHARGDLAGAVELYAEIGSKPEEAEARLRLAASLASAGRRHEADGELSKALAFFRMVDATARIHEAQAVLTAST